MLSIQTVPRGRNDVNVGRKMATFQLFLQSGRAKDLSAPLYGLKILIYENINKISIYAQSLK